VLLANRLHIWAKRRRGDRVIITTGKYTGYRGAIEANVYQKTVDYPDEWSNGYHVMLDTEDLVTVRWNQARSARWPVGMRLVWGRIGDCLLEFAPGQLSPNATSFSLKGRVCTRSR